MKIKKTLILFTVIYAFFICGCKKNHQYKSCFNPDRITASVGQTITFTNCSNYDSGYTSALWNFGDGSTQNSKGAESVQHSYSAPGTYQIILNIGEKENDSRQTKTITIN
jgi:PKD repeat protein